MHFTALLPTFLLASTVAAWSDYQNAVRCGQKNPAVNAAIEQFCSKSNIVVPSDYAKFGTTVNGVHVAISGKTCSPAQWVPREYCRWQFSKLCANGGPKGMGHTKYGRGRCQGWHIDRLVI